MRCSDLLGWILFFNSNLPHVTQLVNKDLNLSLQNYKLCSAPTVGEGRQRELVKEASWTRNAQDREG